MHARRAARAFVSPCRRKCSILLAELCRSFYRTRCCKGSNGFSHQQTWPEAGIRPSSQLKTTCEVEILCVRIADDLEKRRSLRASYFRTVLNQGARDAATPHGWVHKQGIQFGATISSRKHGSESGDGAVLLHDEYRSSDDLFCGHLNRIGMGEQRIAIASVGQGCASLQVLELPSLRDNGRANEKVLQRTLFL